MSADDWAVTLIDDVPVAHPRDWSTDVARSEEGVSVYLQSDAVSFGVVGIYPAEQSPEDVVEQVLESVREEHPGLEVEPLDVDEAEFSDAVGSQAMFMTLDTVGYLWVLSWRARGYSVVVFIQSVERESGDSEEVFHRMCALLNASSAPRRRKKK